MSTLSIYFRHKQLVLTLKSCISKDNYNHGTIKVMKSEGISQQMSTNAFYNFVWTFPTTPEGESQFFKIHRETGQSAFRSGKVYCEDGPLQGPGEHLEFFYLINEGISHMFVKMCYPCGKDFYPHIKINFVEFTSIPSTVNTGLRAIQENPCFFAENERKTRIRWIKNAKQLGLPNEVRGFKILIYMSKIWKVDSLNEVADLYAYNQDFGQSDPNKPIVLKNLDLLFFPFCSDVKICCANQEYFAHKIILSSKSSVFHAMFSHSDMVENRTGQVLIEDVEPAIVEEFLRFVYTGTVQCLSKHVNEICLIADKYDVQPLQSLCENYLLGTLSVENVHERLNFGEIINSDKLIHTCNKIIEK